MAHSSQQLELPGFRFHPTEEELLQFYLTSAISGKKLPFDVIGFLNIYHYEPSALPGKQPSNGYDRYFKMTHFSSMLLFMFSSPGLAKIGEREWYFYVQRDRKRANGGRPNRTTETGFWKATGSERIIFSLASPKRVIGLRKTLVFYKGRTPRGCKTDSVMNEYRLPESHSHPNKDIALCKIYRKATSLKVLEQLAAVEDELELLRLRTPSSPSIYSSQNGHISSYDTQRNDPSLLALNQETEHDDKAAEHETELTAPFSSPSNSSSATTPTSSLKLPTEMEILPDLQVSKMNVDWTQDQFWTQFNSPWF